MPQYDEAVISYVLKFDALEEVRATGISIDDFVNEYRSVWRFLTRSREEHGAIPSRAVLRTRFPDLYLPKVEERDIPMLIASMKQRRKHNDLLRTLTTAAGNLTSFDATDDVISQLSSDLNGLAMRGDERASLVNLFDPAVTDLHLNVMRERRRNRDLGASDRIRTGLKSFDDLTGGLQKQKMVTIIGRSGKGKSWIDLLFIAHAVMQGKTVILYPLEMSLEDTAFRLYTLFTQEMFGPSKVLRNMDLTTGRINIRRARRLLRLLEDQLPGTLYVADVSAMSDVYTVERIQAEVQLHQPDMFWVDYLTLLRPPGGRSADEWGAVQQLSHGIKTTAMICDVVGGCSAQVNRAALTANVLLPRLEHIAYGDSIGQDADQVFSINRRQDRLYYALVKNRGGPEIGRRELTWDPDHGIFDERSGEATGGESDED